MILSSQDIQKQVADLYNNRYIFIKYSLNDKVKERMLKQQDKNKVSLTTEPSIRLPVNFSTKTLKLEGSSKIYPSPEWEKSATSGTLSSKIII